MKDSQSDAVARPHFLLIILLVTGMFLVGLVIVISILRSRGNTPNASLVIDADVYRGTVIDPPLLLDDFTLPASTGSEMSLSNFRGKWVLLFFGYTHCPDICPTTLADYAQVIEQLGEEAEQVQVVFVSVDGERDTPDVLANYVTIFNPSFIGLQGNTETLTRIQPQFNLWYEFVPQPDNAANYSVNHSPRTYLIDPQGELRITYSFGTERDVLVNSIREAVQQG
jgi:protein SCO1/2